MKVRIIVPCSNQAAIHPRVETFLRDLEFHGIDGVELQIVKSRNALPSRARNEGVFGQPINLVWPFKMLGNNVDLFVFLDSDVLPDKQAFIRELTSMTVDTFATGLYQIRRSDKLAIGVCDGPFLRPLGTMRDRFSFKTADWAGGGFLFVGCRALERIRFPWFHEMVMEWMDNDTERADIFGEDVSFCLKAKQAGLTLKILNNLTADHFA